ncbi:Axonemal dynein light chain domain-containing protein 1 [Intoshia linei]|uniref:Axonemal dynein light chain domain-containing protein 1 n=1 Tax=Intoshia linei TaxID=1819745 RepID=A0A177BC44_9BILA|nr:Axonemal dynein light chain domain-containing protein 1 [Intoshia linei]
MVIVNKSFEMDTIPKKILRNLSTIEIEHDNRLDSRPSKHAAWNYELIRNKYHHLLDNIVCQCGAGRDVSYLLDKIDNKQILTKSVKHSDQVRKEILKDKFIVSVKDELPHHIPKTLIPEEYTLVKDAGTLGLEYRTDKYTTNCQNHEKHLVDFPSLTPGGRAEVIVLNDTMDKMIESMDNRIVDGIPQEEYNVILKTYMYTNGSQRWIERFMKLLRNEQHVYNVIFNEIIRQVTVNCIERGTILGKIREYYLKLFVNVEDEMLSMHNQVLSYKAIHSRLSEKLVNFQNNVFDLTEELELVRQNEKSINLDSIQAKMELKEVIAVSTKNVGLLNEYHSVYELQRERLLENIMIKQTESDMWCKAAYKLAMQMTNCHNINAANYLHVAERAWSKLVNFFVLLVQQENGKLVKKISIESSNWRDWMDDLHISAFEKSPHNEKQFKENVNNVDQDLSDISTEINIANEIFNGNILLEEVDNVKSATKLINLIHKLMIDLLKRYNRQNNDPMVVEIDEIQSNILKMHDMYDCRINGDNGIANGINDVINGMDLMAASFRKLENNDLLKFYKTNAKIAMDWNEQLIGIRKIIMDEDEKRKKIIHERNIQDDANEYEQNLRMKNSPILSELSSLLFKYISTMEAEVKSQNEFTKDKCNTVHKHMIALMIKILILMSYNFNEDNLINEKVDSDDEYDWEITEFNKRAHSVKSGHSDKSDSNRLSSRHSEKSHESKNSREKMDPNDLYNIKVIQLEDSYKNISFNISECTDLIVKRSTMVVADLQKNGNVENQNHPELLKSQLLKFTVLIKKFNFTSQHESRLLYFWLRALNLYKPDTRKEAESWVNTAKVFMYLLRREKIPIELSEIFASEKQQSFHMLLENNVKTTNIPPKLKDTMNVIATDNYPKKVGIDKGNKKHDPSFIEKITKKDPQFANPSIETIKLLQNSLTKSEDRANRAEKLIHRLQTSLTNAKQKNRELEYDKNALKEEIKKESDRKISKSLETKPAAQNKKKSTFKK